ncbi:MAG: acyl-CoA dehydrogenase family protein [Hyphomonadaceae bacterium]
MRELLLSSAHKLVERHTRSAGVVDNDALWDDLVEAGFARAQIDDEPVALADAMALVAVLAQHGARTPLGDVWLADWLLSRHGEERQMCVLAGDSDVSLGGAAPAWRLSGDVWGVALAPSVAHVLLARTLPDGRAGLVVVDAKVGRRVERFNIAGEVRVDVRFDDAPAQVLPTRIEGHDIRAMASLVRVAQMLGAMTRALDLALEHAATRVQFGKPLAKLQAVQQMQALMAGQIALTSAALDRATADEADDGSNAGMAKVVASGAAGRVAALAHQILGAMGVSQEHELQRHTRALWAWRDELGAEDEWAQRIGRRVLQAGGGELWPTLAP